MIVYGRDVPVAGHPRPMKFQWITLGFLLAVGLAACDIPKFTPPSWDVPIEVPILSKHYTVDSLLGKFADSLSSQPTSGLLVYSRSIQFGSAPLGQHFAIRPKAPDAFAVNLGSMPLPSQFLQASIPNPGITSGIIPEGNLPPLSTRLAASENIDNLHFERGTLRLSITSYFPARLRFLRDIYLRDREGRLIGPFVLGTLDSGQTQSVSVDLIDKIISGTVSIDSIQLSTPGSNGRSVRTGSSLFDVQLDFLGAELSSVRGRFSNLPVMRSESGSFSLDSSPRPHRFSSATLRNGIFEISVKNHSDIGMEFSFSMPDVLDRKTGTQINRKQWIAANQSLSIPFNLANDSLASLQPTNEIRYAFTIHHVGSVQDANSMITIDRQDNIAVEFGWSGLEDGKLHIESAAGFVSPITSTIDSSIAISNLALPDNFGMDSLHLPEASLRLTLDPGETAYEISGGLDFGVTSSTHSFSITIPTTRVSTLSGSDIVFNGSAFADPLAQLIASAKQFPNRIRFSGTATLNPDYELAVLHDTSAIRGTVTMDLPFRFALKGGIIRDTLRFGVDNQNRWRENITAATVTLAIENHLPVSSTISLHFLGKAHNYISTVPQSVIAAAPAAIGQDGFVVSTSSHLSTFELTATDLDALRSAEYVVLNIQAETPETQQLVKLRSSDFIAIHITSKASYRIE